MDETTPPNEEMPLGDLMPPSEPRSGCLPKAIGLLVIGGIAIGAVIFFGFNFLKGRLFQSFKSVSDGITSSSPPSTAAPPVQVQTPPAEEPSLLLARQLVSADETTRKEIAVQLAASNGSVTPAIEFLSNSLSSAAPEVKADIVVALGLLAKKDPTAIPFLVTALDDKYLRREAIPALGALGPTAGEAIPKLKKIALNKKEPKATRKAAQKALIQIQGKKTAGAPQRSKKGKKKKTASSPK